jgi:integrase
VLIIRYLLCFFHVIEIVAKRGLQGILTVGETRGMGGYDKNIDPMSMNFHVWKPGVKKAGLAPSSLCQTGHTFATLMLDAGEHPGWVQKMMGHETIQMIYETYYSYIKNYDRDERSAFSEGVGYKPKPEEQTEDPGIAET